MTEHHASDGPRVSPETARFREFIQQIQFSLCQPNSSPRFFRKLARVLSRMGISLERVNTLLPSDGDAVKKRVGQLVRIPKMSTYAIGAMINYGVAHMSPQDSFVNIGVWNGFSFLAGLVGNDDKQCVGVDNFSEFDGPRDAFLSRFEKHRSSTHHFYDMDYQAYFEEVHQKPIGFYLYDGNHEYEHQLKGLQAAEPYFSERCVVLVDDTNWEPPRQATLDFIKHSKHEYELLLDKKTCVNQHPTLWNGVMVFQRAA